MSSGFNPLTAAGRSPKKRREQKLI